MGQIVPDAIERYLAGLNRAGNPILDDIARGNETRGLPLVDAEVGALLRVLATTVSATRILEIGTAIGEAGTLEIIACFTRPLPRSSPWSAACAGAARLRARCPSSRSPCDFQDARCADCRREHAQQRADLGVHQRSPRVSFPRAMSSRIGLPARLRPARYSSMASGHDLAHNQILRHAPHEDHRHRRPGVASPMECSTPLIAAGTDIFA